MDDKVDVIHQYPFSRIVTFNVEGRDLVLFLQAFLYRVTNRLILSLVVSMAEYKEISEGADFRDVQNPEFIPFFFFDCFTDFLKYFLITLHKDDFSGCNSILGAVMPLKGVVIPRLKHFESLMN